MNANYQFPIFSRKQKLKNWIRKLNVKHFNISEYKMDAEKDDEMLQDLQMLPKGGKQVYHFNYNYYLNLICNICN